MAIHPLSTFLLATTGIITLVLNAPFPLPASGQDISQELIKEAPPGVQPPPRPPEAKSSPPLAASSPVLFQEENIELGPKEIEGVRITQKWDSHLKNLPKAGSNGKVVYNFSQTLPTVVCSPFRVCDIELEEGESVKQDGVHIGDNVQFDVNLAMSGPEDNPTPHIIIKPKQNNADTTLIVTTDRRSYYLRLISVDDLFMARVGFVYPDSQERQRKEFYAQQERAKEKKRQKEKDSQFAQFAQPLSSLDQINFNYVIEGKAPWKPTRVYNDGIKTYIEMPETMLASEAPALIVVSDNGVEQQVNYRLQGNRYKVDYLFNTAILVAGVGRDQTRVSISREVAEQ